MVNYIKQTRQEWYKYSTDPIGCVKIHRIRMEAPRGITVILTDDQYYISLKEKKKLDKIYQDKVTKYEKRLWKRAKNRTKITICMMCNERFDYYEEVNNLIKIAYQTRTTPSTIEKIGSSI